MYESEQTTRLNNGEIVELWFDEGDSILWPASKDIAKDQPSGKNPLGNLITEEGVHEQFSF